MRGLSQFSFSERDIYLLCDSFKSISGIVSTTVDYVRENCPVDEETIVQMNSLFGNIS